MVRLLNETLPGFIIIVIINHSNIIDILMIIIITLVATISWDQCIIHKKGFVVAMVVFTKVIWFLEDDLDRHQTKWPSVVVPSKPPLMVSSMGPFIGRPPL